MSATGFGISLENILQKLYSSSSHILLITGEPEDKQKQDLVSAHPLLKIAGNYRAWKRKLQIPQNATELTKLAYERYWTHPFVINIFF